MSMVLIGRRQNENYQEEVQWVTQSDLYKKIKWNHDSNDDIILSKPVSIILETVKSDFPHANVWVYQ